MKNREITRSRNGHSDTLVPVLEYNKSGKTTSNALEPIFYLYRNQASLKYKMHQLRTNFWHKINTENNCNYNRSAILTTANSFITY